MTTYQYNLSLTDREMIALKAAIKMYGEHCQTQIESEVAANENPAAKFKAPFWENLLAMEDIFSRLYKNPEQVSSYTP